MNFPAAEIAWYTLRFINKTARNTVLRAVLYLTIVP